MAQATFVSGDPLMVDYTPGADIAAGDVVVTNDTPRVAHLNIASGALGSLATFGGVYAVTADGAISANKKVYWDDTNNKVTLTSTSNKGFGETLEAASGDGVVIKVLHRPF